MYTICESRDVVVSNQLPLSRLPVSKGIGMRKESHHVRQTESAQNIHLLLLRKEPGSNTSAHCRAWWSLRL
jgi:hypothetical protein